MNLILLFLLTFAVELIIYFIFLKNWKEIILYCFLINLFTWPLANLSYGFFGMFWIIEFVVFLVEAVLIKLLFKIGWKKAFIVSFIANLLTAGIGLIFL